MIFKDSRTKRNILNGSILSLEKHEEAYFKVERIQS